MPGKIPVHVVVADGARVVGFVGGAADVARLRSSARLVGVAVNERVAADSDGGSDPQRQLSTEEIAVGVAEGHLRLVLAAADDSDGEAEAQHLEETMCCLVKEPLLDSGALELDALALLRVRVFADLWRRGHFVAFGSKFGVDFLLYEQDPATCHAFAMVVVKDYKTPFATIDIVSHCRMTKMVKKSIVLASQHDAAIVYLSLDHAVLAATPPERR